MSSTLRNDYYEHDAAAHRLVGTRSGTSYGLGDRLKVKVVRVNLDERKIDLEPVQVLSHSPRIKGSAPESTAKQQKTRNRRGKKR